MKYGIIGLIAGVIITLLFLRSCGKDKGITQDNLDDFKYKTDTIYKKEFIHVPVTTFIEVPPKVVTKYVNSPKADPEIRIVYKDTGSIKVVKGDSVYVSIDPEFLKNYPTSPKLIVANIDKKNFDLVLYHPDNTMDFKEYPLNLDKYRYTWEDNTLKAEPIKTKAKITGSSDFAVLYNPLDRYARMELDYTLRYKRVGLMVRGFGQYDVKAKEAVFGPEAGLKFKIR